MHRTVAALFVTVALTLCAASASAQHGNSLDFLYDDDYVALPNESQFDFTTTMTVEVWIWVRFFIGEWQGIVTKGDDSWRIQRLLGLNTVEFTCDTSTGQHTLFGAVAVNDGLWHHVAGVFDSIQGTMTLYVDGIIDQSDVASGMINDTSSTVVIGANSDLPLNTRNWNGRIDEVRIWNVARTQAEIQSTMWSPLSGNEPGLVAYYQFDEGMPGGDNSNPPVNTLPDLTANGNDGMLHNFALVGDTSNWVLSVLGIFTDSFESGDTTAWSTTVP